MEYSYVVYTKSMPIGSWVPTSYIFGNKVDADNRLEELKEEATIWRQFKVVKKKQG